MRARSAMSAKHVAKLGQQSFLPVLAGMFLAFPKAVASNIADRSNLPDQSTPVGETQLETDLYAAHTGAQLQVSVRPTASPGELGHLPR